MKRSRKNSVALVATLIIAMICVSLTPIAAFAATYDKVSVNQGIATVIINNETGETKQLTKYGVAADGIFDENTGTAYIISNSGILAFYNYEYQGVQGELVQIDTGVVGFSGGTTTSINGYDTAAGIHKLFWTTDQIKFKLGLSSSPDSNQNNQNNQNNQSNNQGNNSNNNSNNNGNNNSNNSNNNQNNDTVKESPLSQDGNKVVYTDSEGKVYVLTEKKDIDRIACFNNDEIVMIRFADGSIKYWIYPSQKNESKVTLKELIDSSNGLVVNSDGVATGFYNEKGELKKFTVDELKKGISYIVAINGNNVIVSGNNVSYVVIENGAIKTYTFPIPVGKTVDEADDDANNTVWIKTVDGYLYIWNYDLQKTENPLKLYEVANNCTSLVIDTTKTDSKVVAYYVSGKTDKQQLLTLSEVKDKITPAAETNTNTTVNPSNDTKKNYVKFDHVTIGNHKRVLRDSDGKKQDLFTVRSVYKEKTKTKTYFVKYKGVKYRNVQYARFTKNGNLILKYMDYVKDGKNVNGSTVVVDHVTGNEEVISNDIVKFKYKKGIAVKAVRKDGTKTSLKNY